MYHFQPYVSGRNDAVTTAAAAAALCGYSASAAHHHHHHLAAAAAASAAAMPMQNFLLPNALASLSLGGSHNNHMIGGGLSTASTAPAVAVAKTTAKDPSIKVTLENRDLWSKFHDNTCEMIITRAGSLRSLRQQQCRKKLSATRCQNQAPAPRSTLSPKLVFSVRDGCYRRMFPTIKISIAGLDPEEHYRVVMDIVPVDDCRYKYHNSEWVASGKADPHPAGKYFEHQDAPGKGAQFMRQTLSFHKLKLTNNNFDQHGHPPQIILNSMHKYQPRIHIIRDSDMPFLQMGVINTFTFPETCFIAVTAYQNEQITQLKIDNNPFAKGFRDLKTSRRNQELYDFVHPSLYTHQQQRAEPPYANATNNNNGQQQQQSSSSSSSSSAAQQSTEQQLIGIDNRDFGSVTPSSGSNNRKRSIDSVAAEPKGSNNKQENAKHHRSSNEMGKAPATSIQQTSPKLRAYEQHLLAVGQPQHNSASPQQQRIHDEQQQFAYQQQQQQSGQLNGYLQPDRFQQQQHNSAPYYYQQQQQRNAMRSFMSSAEQTSNAFGFAAAAAAAAQPNNGMYNSHQNHFCPPHQNVSSVTGHQHHHHQSSQQNWTSNPYAAAAVAAAAAAYPANSYNGLHFAYAQQAAAAAAALQSAAGGNTGQTWANNGEAAATTPTQLENRTNFQSSPSRHQQQQQPNYSSFPAAGAAFGGLGTSPPSNSANSLLTSNANFDTNAPAQLQQTLCDVAATTTASLLTAAMAAPPLSMMMNQLRPAPASPANNNIMPTTGYGLAAAEFAARAMQNHQFP